MTTSSKRRQRSYDHRLRDWVFQIGSPDSVIAMGIPRSTAYGWLKPRSRPVVSLRVHCNHIEDLEKRVCVLERRVQRLRSILRLCIVLLRLNGWLKTQPRLPNGEHKRCLLDAIRRTSSCQIRLAKILTWVGISTSRYYQWLQDRECGLADESSCPKSTPTKLTSEERSTMRSMIESADYRHLSTGAVARLAARTSKVTASNSSWSRAIRNGNWKRPRKRVYPAKPKIGIRATLPNEIWHVDTTILRLLDGSRVYLHAVLDNYSRRVLAWRANSEFDTGMTALLLRQASSQLNDIVPNALMDLGVENVNSLVDALHSEGIVKRVLAQVDIVQSNSMIEAWWRQLKHQWLYLNTLDSLDSVRKFVAFYVEQHNSVVPYSAFHGQTPDEMYFQRGADIPAKLKEQRAAARAARIEHNRSLQCSKCNSLQSPNQVVSIETKNTS